MSGRAKPICGCASTGGVIRWSTCASALALRPRPSKCRYSRPLRHLGRKCPCALGMASARVVGWPGSICWFLETHDYGKVPCTAPSSHQLRDVLWGELAKWRRHADEQSARRGDHPALALSALFHLTQDRLVDVGAPEWGAFARTARKEAPEALQGFHAQHLLFVIDEASAVEEPILEAAEGALSTPGSRVLCLAMRPGRVGPFTPRTTRTEGAIPRCIFAARIPPW